MNDDELLQRVRELPDAPLPADIAARVHQRARAAFEDERGRGGRLAGPATAAAVVSAIAIYLTWAVEFLGALAQRG